MTARRELAHLRELQDLRFRQIDRQLAALDAINDRLIVVESKALGASETRDSSMDQRIDSRGNLALVIAAVSLLSTVALTAVELLRH